LESKDITNINNPKIDKLVKLQSHARISLTEKNKTRKKKKRKGRKHGGKSKKN
jgi:hypothetical protein